MSSHTNNLTPQTSISQDPFNHPPDPETLIENTYSPAHFAEVLTLSEHILTEGNIEHLLNSFYNRLESMAVEPECPPYRRTRSKHHHFTPEQDAIILAGGIPEGLTKMQCSGRRGRLQGKYKYYVKKVKGGK